MKDGRDTAGEDCRKPRALRVLLLENDLSEAELVRTQLSEGGFHHELTRVGSHDAFREALRKERFDVILAGHDLQGFDGPSAERLARDACPGVPLIFTSGDVGEEAVIETPVSGAADDMPRQRQERLVNAVHRVVGGKRCGHNEAARNGGEEYRAMFEFAGVGNALVDFHTGQLVRVNPKFCQITGYSEDELLGMAFDELAYPEGRSHNQARFLTVARGETSGYSVEERHVRKDGKIIWMSVDAALVRDSHGRSLAVLATVRDITEHKRAEEELTRLASFPTLSPTLILETNVAGRPTFVNPAAQKAFPSLVEMGRRHPILSDLRSVGREIKESDGLAVTSDVWVDDILYQRLIFAVPGSESLRLYATDVTERRQAEEALKRSEERFRSLVRYASDIIMILDADGVVLFESPAVERVLGFKPEERRGTNFLSSIHPYDLEAVRGKFAALWEDPNGRLLVEYRARDKDGGWHHFEAIGTNLLADPVVRGIVVNARDISERRRA